MGNVTTNYVFLLYEVASMDKKYFGTPSIVPYLQNECQMYKVFLLYRMEQVAFGLNRHLPKFSPKLFKLSRIRNRESLIIVFLGSCNFFDDE
jgi:hypothetical protein